MVNYKCDRCGFNTNRKSNYKFHIYRKHPCKPLINNIDILQIRNDFENDGNYKCNKCSKTFTELKLLDTHLKFECKMLLNFNNIYKYDISTFGKNIYGENGGEIYIVQTDQSNENYFKVGMTNNLINRMRDYRCGSVLEPRLYYYYPCKNIKKVDKIMRNKLKLFCVKREIYNIKLNELRNLLKEIQSKNSELLECKPIIKEIDISECEFCHKIFDSKKRKIIHMNKCEKYKKLIELDKSKFCKFCSKKFTSYKSKWRHEKHYCKKKVSEYEIIKSILNLVDKNHNNLDKRFLDDFNNLISNYKEIII
tara:strand:+ start:731 stop:1654 length:924 start_codon:yes stop_codon:yes gene_type:complete